MAKKLPAPIPRLALSPAEAAASLSVGLDFFNAEVRPHLRLVRRGRKVLIPVTELERWINEHAERPVAEELAA
jgi:excisionase family DNA binding protein